MNDEKVKQVLADFGRDFASRFGGRRILKTPFHFFEWAAVVESCHGKLSRDELLEKFTAYCKRTKAAKTVDHAAEWWCYGRVSK